MVTVHKVKMKKSIVSVETICGNTVSIIYIETLCTTLTQVLKQRRRATRARHNNKPALKQRGSQLAPSTFLSIFSHNLDIEMENQTCLLSLRDRKTTSEKNGIWPSFAKKTDFVKNLLIDQGSYKFFYETWNESHFYEDYILIKTFFL